MPILMIKFADYPWRGFHDHMTGVDVVGLVSLCWDTTNNETDNDNGIAELLCYLNVVLATSVGLLYPLFVGSDYTK